MKLTRVVVRFSKDDRDALDELRERCFKETRRGVSRAAVVRTLVSVGLTAADMSSTADVLPRDVLEASSLRDCPPPPQRVRAIPSDGSDRGGDA